MKYSGYIDGLLAEAAFAKKTGDASWLLNMMSQEEDPIKWPFFVRCAAMSSSLG